jgi:hypothetical protein
MFSRNKDTRFYIAWIAALTVIVLAVYLLMIPPVLGLADSGDFGRVMGITGFKHLIQNESYADRYFAYAHQRFAYANLWGAGYVSTQILVLAATGWIARIVNSNVFDIRWLGTVYLIFFVTATALFVRNSPAVPNRKNATAALSAVLAVLLIVVFGDIGYLTYFQSFFGEPYALVAILLAISSTVALVSRENPSSKLLVLCIVSAAAVATSKIQNAPIGFAFAILVWRMLPLRGDRRWHRQVWVGMSVLLLTSTLMIVAAPDRLKHTNLYQSIFYGVLKDSPNVAADMKELGIPHKYAANAGTNYFQRNTAISQQDPTLHREVLDKLSHQDIVLYYVRHPSRFIDKLNKVAANGMFIRANYLGNYDQSAGKPRGARSHSFSRWSDWKAQYMPHSPAWFLGFYTLYFASLVSCWLRIRSNRVRLGLEAFAGVGLSGIFAAVVPIIGDGEADLGKHLFMFNVCFDMMMVSAATALVYGAIRMLSKGKVS